MKSISAGLLAHLGLIVTTLATIWKVARQDAKAFYFTDHDVDLLFEGNTYKSATGYSRTAFASNNTLAVNNTDVEGLLTNATAVFNSTDILDEELRAGLFDYAEVFIGVVNWADLSQGQLKLARGRLGEVIQTPQGIFRAELRSLTQALAQRFITVYQPECRVDLGSPECGIPIRPPLILRSTAYAVGDRVRVATAPVQVTFALALVNPSFEADAKTIDGGLPITGWAVVSGDWDVHGTQGGLAPQSGSFYLEGGAAASGEVRQDVDLTAIRDIDLASIDTGNGRLNFSAWRANSTPTDTGRIIVEALNSALTVLGTLYDSTAEAITPEDTWAQRSASSVVVPAVTRFIRIRLLYTRLEGGEGNAAFDNLTGSIVDTNYGGLIAGQKLQPAYENRHYKCVTAGTTAATQPAYNTTIGQNTTDGTAVFQAEDAWTRHAVVSAVTDRATFDLTITEARAADDWFNQGALTFELGPNKGKTIEVKDWVQASNRVTLFLSAPFTITVNAIVRIFPGCDKRLATCRDRFNNVVNFRGDPFIPGSDEIIRFPDARV